MEQNAYNSDLFMIMNYVFYDLTLQRRRNERGSQLFAQQFVQAQIKENINALCYGLIVGEIYQSKADSPHKGPWIFFFDGVIMK